MAESDGLSELARAVMSSAKYQHISPSFVERVARQELEKARKFKETLKAVKNKLHQVGGAYLEEGVDYDTWLGNLNNAASSPNSQAFKAACQDVMRQHASTRERLPILNEFYTDLFAELPPVHTALDLACGLNPLAIPWMPLADGASYYACDIYQDMTAFLDDLISLLPITGKAWTCDVMAVPPSQKVDLALLLKTIPCLEQVDRDAGMRLLDAIDADYILVSYPVHSLGGREKGMLEHYEAGFREMVEGRGWDIKRFEFETELVFLVGK